MYFIYMGVLSVCIFVHQKRALDSMGQQLVSRLSLLGIKLRTS